MSERMLRLVVVGEALVDPPRRAERVAPAWPAATR